MYWCLLSVCKNVTLDPLFALLKGGAELYRNCKHPRIENVHEQNLSSLRDAGMEVLRVEWL